MFGTWKHPTSERVWVPLTEGQREKLTAYANETNYCNSSAISEQRPICDIMIDRLSSGGHWKVNSLLLKYWALNLGVAFGTFAFLLGLIFLLPTVARRYWNWLKA